ncbi:hypothetical protein KSS87_017305 [Heliosperma pusillum]|nr:hypothetical protein KSS87_017305 [Heliosperma pusillum]
MPGFIPWEETSMVISNTIGRNTSGQSEGEGSNRNEEVEQGEEEEEAGGSKPSGKVSYVWKYYEKVPVPNKPRHFRCVCTVCRDIKKIMKSYAWSIGTGFGSMSRHLRNDHGITASGVGSQTQTQLSGFMSEQAGGGLTNSLLFYYEMLNIIDFDVEIYVQKCIDVLRELCKIYAKDKGESSSSSSVTTKSARFDDQLHSILFRRTQSSSSSTSTLATKELDDYLTHGVDTNDTDFNILLWWKARSIQFPLLSKIARDVLVVPASTVASESAFSAGGRVLDDKRSRLAPPTVKMCVCKRDWDLAKIRRQGAKEFDPLEADEIVATDASSGN